MAHAHLISAGNAAITVNSDRGVLLVGVPVSFFKDIDQNQDGLLQPIEIKENRLQMIDQLERAFQLKIGGAAVEAVDDQLITSIKADHQEGAPQIDWLRLLKIHPADLNLPIEVKMNKALVTSEYVFQVKRMGSEEMAFLSPFRPSHTFFKNNWGTLQSFFVEGWAHIVTGYDHLIFIMAMLVAAINLKRWLLVLSSFTVAHGVTYSLATFGMVQVKPEWIEPIIALTIVATAAFGLFKVQLLIRTEMLVVFALGLFHGLGFASAMASQLNTLRFPITSVIGFNLGVEAGQIAIALVVWLFFNFIKSSTEWTERAKSVTLWISFVLGGHWLFERIS
jgi:hydrogenase/urease accessory protein HupE